MQKLLPFFIAFFCFSTFYINAQDVSLDLEIVCETQDVCGQELWKGLVYSGDVDLYINDFINFEGDSLEVTIIQNGVIHHQFEIPQGYDIDINNTDIIFQGKIAQSTTLPFITISENSFAFSIEPLSFTFSYQINGNSFEQSIDIFTAYESSIGEVYMPNCADYITTDCFIYTLPDTLYYCNNTNENEICSMFLKHASVYDGGYLELKGFIFKNETPEAISSSTDCPFYSNGLVDSISNHPNYVGEFSDFSADEIQNSEDNLLVKFYVENVNTDFMFNEYVNYFDMGLPVVPLVKAEDCILSFDVRFGTEVYCNGETYWDRDELDVYLTDVEGYENEDSIEITIYSKNEYIAGGMYNISINNEFVPLWYAEEPNTLFSGKIIISDSVPFMQYNTAICSDIVMMADYLYFSAQIGEEVIVDSLKVVQTGGDLNRTNYPPACVEAIPTSAVYNVPNTLQYCSTNCGIEYLNWEEFCYDNYCGGTAGVQINGAATILIFKNIDPPEEFDLYYNPELWEYYIEGGLSAEVIEDAAANGDYLTAGYYEWFGYNLGEYQLLDSFNLDLESENNCECINLDLEFVCGTSNDYCGGEEYWDKSYIDVYLNGFEGTDEDSLEVNAYLRVSGSGTVIEDIYSDIYDFSFEHDGYGFYSVFSGIVTPSNQTPFFTYLTDCGYDNSYFSKVIFFEINKIGEEKKFDQEITITANPADAITSEYYFHPCEHLFPDAGNFYNAPDTIFYCNDANNLDEICVEEYCIDDFPDDFYFVLFEDSLPQYFSYNLNSGLGLHSSLSEYYEKFIGFTEVTNFTNEEDVVNFETLQGENIKLGICSTSDYNTGGFRMLNPENPISYLRSVNQINLPIIESCTPITVNGTNYFEEGTYQNIQNLTNQFGCDSTVTQEITILPNHEIILDEIISCEPVEINEILYTEIGSFEDIQTFSNQQGCDSVVAQVITIFEPPSVTINEGTDTIYQTISSGEFATISSTSNATEYNWLPNGETTPFIYATESGLYSVEVTNENGCTAIASVYLNLDIVSDISTLAKEQLQLFPNPASDNFQLINIPESVEAIKVYNINGQIIANFSTPISVIDTQNWNAGYYLIQFIGKNEQFAKPLIVE